MDMYAMGRRGRRWMASEYNWTKIAKEMSDLYRNLINKQL
jgi:glycosyltransferase involved in cell wall biosynthesis